MRNQGENPHQDGCRRTSRETAYANPTMGFDWLDTYHIGEDQNDSIFWPRLDIKRRIRQLLSQRIRGIISKFGQNLNRRISKVPENNIRLVFVLLLASSIGDQNTLSEFSEDLDSVENELHDHKDNDVSNCEKCVIPYTRVSSEEQKKNGRSINSQKDEISAIVERDPEMSYHVDFIKDKAESGTDFNRNGIQKVALLAKDSEVTHIIVDTIDRIGRNVAQSLMFIETMRKKHDVKILQRDREFDIRIPEDKMVLNHKLMIAEFSTQNRARSSKRSSADHFINDRQWCSWYNTVPFGYKIENEDGNDPESKGWIEKIDDMEHLVKDTFNIFLKEKNYSKVADYINSNYSDRINEFKKNNYNQRKNADEEYEMTNNPMSGREIKSIITNPVYKGEPMIPVTEFDHHDPNPYVPDSKLEIVNEYTWSEAQEIVASISDKYSTEDDLTLNADKYAQEFDPFAIEAVCPEVKLVCPKCSSDLNSNGYIHKLNDKYGNRDYVCTNNNCDYSSRWPKKEEKDKIEILTKIKKFDMIP